MNTEEKTTTTFDLHDRVKIDGENGFYWVIGWGQDGSIALWGGDKNPNGYRQHRAIMPDRLRPDNRPLQKKNYPALVVDVQSE